MVLLLDVVCNATVDQTQKDTSDDVAMPSARFVVLRSLMVQ